MISWGRWMGCAIGVASLSHCLAPTEIVVWLSTDVPCSQFHGVAIGVDVPGRDPLASNAVGNTCSDDGGLGSIVITPSQIDEAVGIYVALGVGEQAEQCFQDASLCVVARRSLRFDPHHPLTLPIDLEGVCEGNPCDPSTTCIAGLCVDSGVECDGATCSLPPPTDAGIVDASIDAGSCFAGPKVVSLRTPNTSMRPRIARSGSDWAIAYGLAAGGVAANQVSVSGPTVNVSNATEVTIVDSSMTATALGPLGVDSNSYALAFDTTNGFSAQDMPFGGGAPVTFGYLSAATSASDGMFFDPKQSVFVMGDVLIGTLQLNAWSLGGTNVKISVTPGVSQASLAAVGETYYVATVDTQNDCNLLACTYDANGWQCPPSSPTPIDTTGKCTLARVGATTTTTLVAYVDGTSLLAATSPWGTPIAVGTISTPPAVSVVPVGPTQFRVLWQNGTAIVSSIVDTVAHSATPAQPVVPELTYQFDAVADDPAGSLGYAIIHASSSSGNVSFERFCQ